MKVVRVGAWGTKQNTFKKAREKRLTNWSPWNEANVYGERPICMKVVWVGAWGTKQKKSQKRPTSLKRDLCKQDETCICGETPFVWKSCELASEIQNKIHIKRVLNMWKVTYIFKMWPVYIKTETYVYEVVSVGDWGPNPNTCKERPKYLKKYLNVWQETCMYENCVSWGLYICMNIYT